MMQFKFLALRHFDRLKAAALSCAMSFGFSSAVLPTMPTEAATVSAVRSAVAFSCRESEATIRARGGASVQMGTTRIYIGYQQVSANNKNPILIRFDAGRRIWCRTNYEVTGDDGTGYGLLWDGDDRLYGVFTSTGTQGSANQDFRRFATRGWLTNYGQGGGAKVAIIARLDPATGSVRAATFLSSQLSNGNTNSMQVNSLALRDDRLVVNASAWFSPRRVNRSRMRCNGTSPFPYTIEFQPNLNAAVRAVARGCS